VWCTAQARRKLGTVDEVPAGNQTLVARDASHGVRVLSGRQAMEQSTNGESRSLLHPARDDAPYALGPSIITAQCLMREEGHYQIVHEMELTRLLAIAPEPLNSCASRLREVTSEISVRIHQAVWASWRRKEGSPPRAKTRWSLS
jgi:hypothetical protein